MSVSSSNTKGKKDKIAFAATEKAKVCTSVRKRYCTVETISVFRLFLAGASRIVDGSGAGVCDCWSITSFFNLIKCLRNTSYCISLVSRNGKRFIKFISCHTYTFLHIICCFVMTSCLFCRNEVKSKPRLMFCVQQSKTRATNWPRSFVPPTVTAHHPEANFMRAVRTAHTTFAGAVLSGHPGVCRKR